MAEKALILINNREKTLAKLDNLKIDGMTAMEKENMEKLSKEFSKIFIHYCSKIFGLKPDQLKNLDKEDLTEIAEMIVEKTSKVTNLQKFVVIPLLVLIPIAGWIILELFIDDGTFKSSCYKRLYRKIKNHYGKDWFPYEALKKKLSGG